MTENVVGGDPEFEAGDLGRAKIERDHLSWISDRYGLDHRFSHSHYPCHGRLVSSEFDYLWQISMYLVALQMLPFYNEPLDFLTNR